MRARAWWLFQISLANLASKIHLMRAILMDSLKTSSQTKKTLKLSQWPAKVANILLYLHSKPSRRKIIIVVPVPDNRMPLTFLKRVYPFAKACRVRLLRKELTMQRCLPRVNKTTSGGKALKTKSVSSFPRMRKPFSKPSFKWTPIGTTVK